MSLTSKENCNGRIIGKGGPYRRHNRSGRRLSRALYSWERPCRAWYLTRRSACPARWSHCTPHFFFSSRRRHTRLTCHWSSDVCSSDLLRQHFSDILSGMYSLGGRPDQAVVQQRVRLHPAFEAIAYQGIPDVRVVLYRNEPAMAMLRLPTQESGGRANLHQGGIGAGIDLETGETHHAVQRNRFVRVHPDTLENVIG